MYQAVELSVKGRLLRGVVRTPEGDGPFPAVIFYHGFTVDKVGMMRLHEIFARRCVEAGYACVRFDFYGLGESDGDFAEMTIGSEMEEAEAIFCWTCSQPYIDTAQVVLSGHSMGALVASVIAPKTHPKALLLWAPALTMFYQAGLRARTLVGSDGERLGYRRHGARQSVYGRSRDDGILEMARGYDGPVLHIHGSEDEQIPVDVSGRYRYLYGAQYRSVIIEGANHQFSSIPWRETVYAESLRFLQEQRQGK